MELTQNETKILEIIRGLKPFEVLEIKADRQGKPDTFIFHREQKVVLSTNLTQFKQ